MFLKISSFISQRVFEDPSTGSLQLPKAINLGTGKNTIYQALNVSVHIFNV